MRDLDVIIILESGAKEQKFAEYILNQRKNSQDRLLWFFPKKKIAYDNEIGYKLRTDKETFQMNWKGEKPNQPNWHPYFIINPPTYEDWLEKPEFRLSDIPKPENNVLFVDDIKSTGKTIFQSQCELVSLGYQKERIFSYAYKLNIMNQYELENSNCEIFATSYEFLKSIEK
ncbi:MAG: hypothetical protein ACQESE_01260 [Nanobdellota archaeon]